MNLGPAEIGMLFLVLVLVFGPARISDIGKSMGEAVAGFRKASKESEESEESLPSAPEEKPSLSEKADDEDTSESKQPESVPAEPAT
jgi:sec-independent protein translocase protein TatA